MEDARTQDESRFNVLLTEDRPHSDVHWISQLPRLLQPQGVMAYVAGTGREAVELAERTEIHAAVIDLGTPIGDAADAADPVRAAPGGFWMLELMRRLPSRPPVVMLRPPAFSRRQADRILTEALRLGVFSVMNKPVDLEQLLAVFQRLIDRRYRGAWPGRRSPRDRLMQ